MTLGQRIDRQIVYGLLGVTMLLALVLLFRRPRAAKPAVAPVMRVAAPARHDHPMLDEQEGDEINGDDEVEAHDMFRRVRDVVEENPEEAARVLRNWIYQGR
jgi:flagellar biosynthesis/type III secretory pathway M-ring protein FliF/YscJ